MQRLSILLIVVLFYCCSNILQAQVPGYQGKRFFIEFNGAFFPNFSSITADNKGVNRYLYPGERGDVSYFTFKDRYSLSFQYVTGRKSSFKAAYAYQIAGLTRVAINLE